jgi:hypothetical protein
MKPFPLLPPPLPWTSPDMVREGVIGLDWAAKVIILKTK